MGVKHQSESGRVMLHIGNDEVPTGTRCRRDRHKSGPAIGARKTDDGGQEKARQTQSRKEERRHNEPSVDSNALEGASTLFYTHIAHARTQESRRRLLTEFDFSQQLQQMRSVIRNLGDILQCIRTKTVKIVDYLNSMTCRFELQLWEIQILVL